MSKLALITGGQRGIGLGIAQALAADGWSLALMAEKPGTDPEVEAALTALPGARYWRHDLREAEAASALLDSIETAQGPISALVSNAGVPARVRGDMLDLAPENYDFTMEINLRGAFFLAQAMARRMIGRDGFRSISFVTSVSAEMVSVERAEYCLSKAGAHMMVQLFAARLAAEGIGVYELRPGIIRTPMTEGVADRYDDLIAGGLVPAARWGTPEDIGQVIVPLVRGQMAFATGAVIPVDGGLSIHRL